MKLRIFALSLFLLSGLNGLHGQTIQDFDGNIYGVVTIGKQVWMKENLNVSHFNDGTEIPVVTDSAIWVNLSSAGMCWHDNDKATNTANKFGALYNWYVVGTGKLCPTGWHVSTNQDWLTLLGYLGAEDAAIKLKAAGTVWQSSYDSEESYEYEDLEESEQETESTETEEILRANNESGFSALPGGYRDLDNSINNNGENGHWWCFEAGYCNAMNYDFDYVRRNDGLQGQNLGASVRCVKD